MKIIHQAAGSVLIKEGAESDQMYLMQNGKLRVYVVRNGKEVTLGEIGENELVGEVSFLDNKPRSATVIAMEDSHLFEIPRANFEEQLKAQPAWISGLIRTLAARLRDANNKIKV